jgi:hypothetical protein
MKFAADSQRLIVGGIFLKLLGAYFGFYVPFSVILLFFLANMAYFQ